MYNPLYESLRKAKVDRRTATKVSVELNPELFVNRQELMEYRNNTTLEMTALRNHSVEISRQCEETTVALLSERDQQMREAFTRHHNETWSFLSGVDKRMAENEASLKQHRIESEARQDKRLHQMDVRATEREAQGRAENQKFLAEMDKREALRQKEQEKREAERQKEQEKLDPLRGKPRPSGLGRIARTAQLSLGFQAGVFCCSMYRRTTSIGAPPQEEAKQDGDQSTPFQ